MSRRSNLVQWFVLVGAYFLAVSLTTQDSFGTALAWCCLAVGIGVLCGTVLGCALDEYRPPKPGWWRVGWRR
jgi:hypothetical protein